MSQGTTKGVPIDPDGTLANNSDVLVPSQKAVKTYAAPIISPNFTGTPTVPTAALGTNTTQAASTAFVLANSSSAYPIIPIFSGKRRYTSFVSMSTTAGYQGNVIYIPYVTEKPHTVVSIGVNVVTAIAASNCKFALYADDGVGNPTGSPLDFSGDISTATTGIKSYTFTTPISLTSQLYWMSIQVSAGITIEYATTVMNLFETRGKVAVYQTQAYGAFPVPSNLLLLNNSPLTFMIPQ